METCFELEHCRDRQASLSVQMALQSVQVYAVKIWVALLPLFTSKGSHSELLQRTVKHCVLYLTINNTMTEVCGKAILVAN